MVCLSWWFWRGEVRGGRGSRRFRDTSKDYSVKKRPLRVLNYPILICVFMVCLSWRFGGEEGVFLVRGWEVSLRPFAPLSRKEPEFVNVKEPRNRCQGNRFPQPMKPGGPVRQIGLSYRPPNLEIDCWSLWKMYKYGLWLLDWNLKTTGTVYHPTRIFALYKVEGQ